MGYPQARTKIEHQPCSGIPFSQPLQIHPQPPQIPTSNQCTMHQINFGGGVGVSNNSISIRVLNSIIQPPHHRHVRTIFRRCTVSMIMIQPPHFPREDDFPSLHREHDYDPTTTLSSWGRFSVVAPWGRSNYKTYIIITKMYTTKLWPIGTSVYKKTSYY